MKARLAIAVCAIISGCSNPFSPEGEPELPDVWFITKDGIIVMSEYPDEMLSRLNIDTDSLGTLLDAWNDKTQKVLEEFMRYDPHYLSSPDLTILFASQDYINKWHNTNKQARGIYIRTKKIAGVSVWWDLDAFDKYDGDDMKGLLWVSRWTLIIELTHYYQHRARKNFSECEASAVREYFFYGMLLHPDCED